MAPIVLRDTLQVTGALTALADAAYVQEPLGGAALVGLLMGRPGQRRELSLTAYDGDRLVGWMIGSRSGTTGFVDAIAVAEDARRRGVATRLLDEIQARLIALGATELAVGGNTWWYAWPGVDRRYAAAHALFERWGYRVVDEIRNMDVDPVRQGRRTAAPLSSARGAITTRRGTADDARALADFAAREFPETPWRGEVTVALAHHPSGVHLGALPDGRIVGFGCHGTYRPDWFGPLGTAREVRGSGLGEALLRLCLADLADAGYREAQIGWIGPADFYARTVGARPGRIFSVFRRPVDESDTVRS